MRLFARRKSQPRLPSPDIFDYTPPAQLPALFPRDSYIGSPREESEMCRSDRYLAKLQKKEKTSSRASTSPKRPVRPRQSQLSSCAPQLVLDLSIDPTKLHQQAKSTSFSITYQQSYDPSLHSQPTTRKAGHRRSRSFSTITNLSTVDPSVIGQPWRDREVWAAIHSRLNEPLYDAIERGSSKGVKGGGSVGGTFQRELGGTSERSRSMRDIQNKKIHDERKSSSENGHARSREFTVMNPDPVPMIDQEAIRQKIEGSDVDYTPGYATALYRSNVEEDNNNRSNRSTLSYISQDASSISTARYTSRSKRRSASFSTISSDHNGTPTISTVQYSPPPPPRPPRSTRRPSNPLLSVVRSSSTTVDNPFKDSREILNVETDSVHSSSELGRSNSTHDSKVSVDTAQLEEKSGLFNYQAVSPLDPQGFDRIKQAFGIPIDTALPRVSYRPTNDVQHRRKASVPMSVNASPSPICSTVLDDPIELNGKSKKHYYSIFGSIKTHQSSITPSDQEEVLKKLGELMMNDEASETGGSETKGYPSIKKEDQVGNLSPLLPTSRPSFRRMMSFIDQSGSSAGQAKIPWAHAKSQSTDGEGRKMKIGSHSPELTSSATPSHTKPRETPNAFLAKPPVKSAINGRIPMPHSMPSDTALTFLPTLPSSVSSTSLPRSTSASSIPHQRVPSSNTTSTRSTTLPSSVFNKQYMAELEREESPMTPGYPITPPTPRNADAGVGGECGVAISINGKSVKQNRLRSSYSPASPLKTASSVGRASRVRRGGWL